MPTIGSVTKTARITANDWEILKNEMQTTFSAWVHERLNEKPVFPEGTPRNHLDGVSDDQLADLDGMMKFYGCTLGDAVKALQVGMNDGTLEYRDGSLVGVTELDLSNFYDACHEKNVEPQKMIDKAARDILRS